MRSNLRGGRNRHFFGVIDRSKSWLWSDKRKVKEEWYLFADDDVGRDLVQIFDGT